MMLEDEWIEVDYVFVCLLWYSHCISCLRTHATHTPPHLATTTDTVILLGGLTPLLVAS